MKTPTEPDPIIEERHAIRREIAARFDNDIHRIASDARRRQAASGLPVWPGPSHPASHIPVTPRGGDDNAGWHRLARFGAYRCALAQEVRGTRYSVPEPLSFRSQAPAGDRISRSSASPACQLTPSREPDSRFLTEARPDMLGGSPASLGEAELRGWA